MSEDWAKNISHQLLSQGLIQKGICLILGACDTGKTTLAATLASCAASSGSVGIIDADVGQSHIGPPTTVGWAIVDKTPVDFCQLSADGISFVGDITPVGHLLQLTAAIVQTVRQVSKVANSVIIDTPGLINGPAAEALWWTVQRLVQPELILAVQRDNELSGILTGLEGLDLRVQLVSCPSQIQLKSPNYRRDYRQGQFEKYFKNSCLYTINLNDLAVQTGWNSSREDLAGRLVALIDSKGLCLAVGLIKEWQNDSKIAVVRIPQLDTRQISCIAIGDLTIEIANE